MTSIVRSSIFGIQYIFVLPHRFNRLFTFFCTMQSAQLSCDVLFNVFFSHFILSFSNRLRHNHFTLQNNRMIAVFSFFRFFFSIHRNINYYRLSLYVRFSPFVYNLLVSRFYFLQLLLLLLSFIPIDDDAEECDDDDGRTL